LRFNGLATGSYPALAEALGPLHLDPVVFACTLISLWKEALGVSWVATQNPARKAAFTICALNTFITNAIKAARRTDLQQRVADLIATTFGSTPHGLAIADGHPLFALFTPFVYKSGFWLEDGGELLARSKVPHVVSASYHIVKLCIFQNKLGEDLRSFVKCMFGDMTANVGHDHPMEPSSAANGGIGPGSTHDSIGHVPYERRMACTRIAELTQTGDSAGLIMLLGKFGQHDVDHGLSLLGPQVIELPDGFNFDALLNQRASLASLEPHWRKMYDTCLDYKVFNDMSEAQRVNSIYSAFVAFRRGKGEMMQSLSVLFADTATGLCFGNERYLEELLGQHGSAAFRKKVMTHLAPDVELYMEEVNDVGWLTAPPNPGWRPSCVLKEAPRDRYKCVRQGCEKEWLAYKQPKCCKFCNACRKLAPIKL